MRKTAGIYTLLSSKVIKKIILSLIVILIFDFFLFPFPALASDDLANAEEKKDNNKEIYIFNPQPAVMEEISPEFDFSFPENNELTVKWTGRFIITAYNSEVGQCDDSPCITANGFDVCEHGVEDTVAVNFLKFGTKIKIPELYGNRVFVVRDRMNKRYDNRIDIWMTEKADAVNFGKRAAKIEVLAN